MVPRCRLTSVYFVSFATILLMFLYAITFFNESPSLRNESSPAMSAARGFFSGGKRRPLRHRAPMGALPRFISVEGFISAPVDSPDYVAFGQEAPLETDVNASGANDNLVAKHPAHVAPNHMRLLLRPRITCNNKTLLLVAVCSSVTHFDLRHAVRHTWGAAASTTWNRRRSAVRLVFVVGRPSEGYAQAQAAVDAESEKFGDILQADFIDSYANLSVKTLVAFRWTLQTCSRRVASYDQSNPLTAPFFFMKTDDDVFINVPNVVRYVTDLIHDGRRRFITGRLFQGTRPDTDRRSKWYTPHSVYGNSTYPPYLSGTAYVMSGDLLPRLYDAAARSDLFWLEDIYITGMLARLAGAALIHNERFGYRKTSIADVCHLRQALSTHQLLAQELYDLWRNLQKPHVRCPDSVPHFRISRR